MADFSTWDRATLERLASELQADNQRLRQETTALLEAWRAEVRQSSKPPVVLQNGGNAK